jgi:hypothetical protein
MRTSEERSASILKTQHLVIFEPENGGSMLLWNVRNKLPVDTV